MAYNGLNMNGRGKIELTSTTFAKYSRYMKIFKKKLYYASFRVIKRNAKKDTLIEPSGRRIALCF